MTDVDSENQLYDAYLVKLDSQTLKLSLQLLSQPVEDVSDVIFVESGKSHNELYVIATINNSIDSDSENESESESESGDSHIVGYDSVTFQMSRCKSDREWMEVVPCMFSDILDETFTEDDDVKWHLNLDNKLEIVYEDTVIRFKFDYDKIQIFRQRGEAESYPLTYAIRQRFIRDAECDTNWILSSF